MTYREKLRELESAVQSKIDEAGELSKKFIVAGAEGGFNMNVMAQRNMLLEEAIDTLAKFNDLIVRMKTDKIDPDGEYEPS